MVTLTDIETVLASLRNEAGILRDLAEDPDPRLVRVELEHRWLHRPTPTYAIESGLVFRHLDPESQPIAFPKPKTPRKPKLMVIGHAFPSKTRAKDPELKEMKLYQDDKRDCNLFVKYRIKQIREDCKNDKTTSLDNFRKIHYWARDAVRWLKHEQRTLRQNLDLVREKQRHPSYIRDQYDAEV